MHSELGPVRQNPIQRTVRSVHMCVHCTVHTIVAHNRLTAQKRPDNYPCYPIDNHHFRVWYHRVIALFWRNRNSRIKCTVGESHVSRKSARADQLFRYNTGERRADGQTDAVPQQLTPCYAQRCIGVANRPAQNISLALQVGVDGTPTGRRPVADRQQQEYEQHPTAS